MVLNDRNQVKIIFFTFSVIQHIQRAHNYILKTFLSGYSNWDKEKNV